MQPHNGTVLMDIPGLSWFPSPSGVHALYTDACFGDLKAENTMEKLRQALYSLGAVRVFFMNQDHTRFVHCVDEAPQKSHDGLWSLHEGDALVVRTADCLPILLYDEKSGAVCAVHAGWRGLFDGVLEEALVHFTPTWALIGAHAGFDSYEVGTNVLDAMRKSRSIKGNVSAFDAFFSPQNPVKNQTSSQQERRYLIDLSGIATKIIHMHAPLCAVKVLGACTIEEVDQKGHPRFFSFRARKDAQRFGTVLMRVPRAR